MKLKDIEKFLGNAKFAVIIILIFAVAMTVGTFFESYFGTEYAGRSIYKSYWFFAIQILMLSSIFYALLHRLPPKKRLYGFYTVHVGFITLFCGSFITYYAGIDGNLTLRPGAANRIVSLSRDMFYITDHEADNEISYLLPYTYGEREINETYKDITLKKFLPFSDQKVVWKSSSRKIASKTTTHSSEYYLYNENVSQKLILSLSKEAIDFESTTQLGPLNVHYLPIPLHQCFIDNNKSGYIIWNSIAETCYTPESKNLKLRKADSGKTFLVDTYKEVLFSFFPDQSPWPLALKDSKLEPIKDAPLRVFSKNLFTETPNLFLFGEAVAYYSSDDQAWVTEKISVNKEVDLPWMGFKLRLNRHEEQLYPEYTSYYQRPIQVNNKVIKGEQRAALIEVQGKEYWVTSERPIALLIKGKKFSFYLGNQTLKLPFELSLRNFKMDTDPGTNNPASYESFVNLFSKEGVEKHHIYMNNPLKKDNFTFYQASYFKDDQSGGYGSVLSVNFDPGRFWKYLGSLLIVLGAVWHFYIRRSKLLKEQYI